MNVIGIIMSSGKASVDVALYTLLPIMVVMLVIMRFLEAKGIVDALVRWIAPILKPFGLTGMSTFALIQLNFVSFAAPLATLSIMEKRGVSDRHMAATLAMVFAMGQGNVFYPLTPFGLHWAAAIVISIIGGLAAAALTYHVLGRKLSAVEGGRSGEVSAEEPAARGVIGIINSAGADAIRLALGSVPMLILSMTIVGILESAGAVTALERFLAVAGVGQYLSCLCDADAGEMSGGRHRLFWRDVRPDSAGKNDRQSDQCFRRSADTDL